MSAENVSERPRLLVTRTVAGSPLVSTVTRQAISRLGTASPGIASMLTTCPLVSGPKVWTSWVEERSQAPLSLQTSSWTG